MDNSKPSLHFLLTILSRFVNESSTFVKAVALGSVQFGGIVNNATLPSLSPALAPPLPPSRTGKNGKPEQSCVTLAAGKHLLYT